MASQHGWRERFAGSYGALVLAVGLCAITGVLAWLAFRGTVETSRSARLLLERRGAEQLALLSAGFSQDMKGAQATVLVPITHPELVLEPPYGLAEVFARGFARFPYPESFFAWKQSHDGDGLLYFFNRAQRPPSWHTAGPPADPYPVQVVRDPPAVRGLIAEARRRATRGRPFAVIETELAGTPYQVVVHLLYHSESGHRLFGLVGFTVNLVWVRNVYFEELTRQLANIGGQPDEISLSVVDERGVVVTTSRPPASDGWTKERSFPLVFADRALFQTLPRDERLVRYWTVRTGPARGSLVPDAVRSSIAYVFICVAVVAAVVGLFATVRAVRVAARLAAMKSDFVSGVTHELKTPLSSIALIADMLASGRYDSPGTIRDYARLLSRETKTLTQLLDNLLASARLTDVESAYSYEPVHVGELVEDALERFRGVLLEQQFTVEVEVPPDLPQVRADRSALLQVLENLVDNAIKYARPDRARTLRIRAAADGHRVVLSVADSGIGIHDDEIERVCDKFFRGRGARSSGSGLGLAIVRQIIEAHQGRLVIDSQVGAGTRVDVVLPAESA
jgi:signal transduction histidine kinase